MSRIQCYFLCDSKGQPKALLNCVSAATIIADGHGTWKAMPDGTVGYVIQNARSFSTGFPANKLNVYLYSGDYLVETDERPW